MKNLFLFLLLSVTAVRAHDHVEVGVDPLTANRLGFSELAYQVATYVPRNEFFSGDLPNFPGGYHAAELTFTTETNALDSADGANPRIEIVSVSGPASGSFAFWEVGATSPTFLLPAGWAGTGASFPVLFQGDTHAHGRCFTMDKPGSYTVTFRAVDNAGRFTASANKTITFVAQQPPKLSLGVADGSVSLAFTSRSNFVYDLQVCTDLASGAWANVESHTGVDGDGGTKKMQDPLVGRPRGFYRLVEY